MLFVDTSVWIDFLAGRDSVEIQLLMRALQDSETVCFTGMVLQEILQGVHRKEDRMEIEERFAPFVEIFPRRSTYRLAADLFRQARSIGHPVRSGVDCLIAACCIEQDAQLLEKDRDFQILSQVSALQLAGK